MSFDVSKLSPAPWRCDNGTGNPGDDDFIHCTPEDWGGSGLIEHFRDGCVSDDDWENLKENVRFCALARQAFDVMMRRGWNPTKRPDGQWVVIDMIGNFYSSGSNGWPDPFTALVKADKGYTENVEKKGGER